VHTLIWQPAAVSGLLRLRSSNTQAAKDVRAAITALDIDARPPESAPLGTAGLRRLRSGESRVLYEVDDIQHAVHVLNIGRVPT
jgi:mRNA interferase RelE/StbE